METVRKSRWLGTLGRVEAAVYLAEKLLCSVALAVMAVAIAMTVVVRNLNLGLPNLGELGLAAMVPLTLVGGALCTCRGSHVTVDLVRHSAFRPVRVFAELAVISTTLVFAYFYMRSGVYLFEEFFATGDKLLDLGTPLWMLAACFPLGMGLMIFHAATRLLYLIAGHEGAAERSDAA